MDPLRRLAQLTRMKPRPGPGADWERVRTALGVDVPADYKELIDRFGAGLFGYYIKLFGPGVPGRGGNLAESGLYWDEHLKWDWERRPSAIPEHLRGREFTVVNWGATEDAAKLFWIAEPGTPPERWETAIHTTEWNRWEFHPLPTVEVLLGLVRGDLTELIPAWPEGEQVGYHRYLGDEEEAG